MALKTPVIYDSDRRGKPKAAGDSLKVGGTGYIRIGSVPIVDDGGNTSASVLSNQTVIKHTSSASPQTRKMYVMFQIPGDFASFPSNNLVIDVYQNGTPTSFTLKAIRSSNGTVDAGVNAVDIKSTAANDTFQTKTNTMSGTYAAGDHVVLEFISIANLNKINGFGRISIAYNRN